MATRACAHSYYACNTLPHRTCGTGCRASRSSPYNPPSRSTQYSNLRVRVVNRPNGLGNFCPNDFRPKEISPPPPFHRYFWSNHNHAIQRKHVPGAMTRTWALSREMWEEMQRLEDVTYDAGHTVQHFFCGSPQMRDREQQSSLFSSWSRAPDRPRPTAPRAQTRAGCRR